RAYNNFWMGASLSADIAIGNKDKGLTGEESSVGLQKSLKNQLLGELYLNLYVNALEKYWFRPYFGIGYYRLQYPYDSNADEKTENFIIQAPVLKYGISILLSKIDTESAGNLWREFGVFRVSL